MSKHIFYYDNDKNTPAAESLTALAGVARALSKAQKEVAKTKGIGGDIDDYLDLVEDGSIKLHLQTKIFREGKYVDLDQNDDLARFLEYFREQIVIHSISSDANTVENLNSLKSMLAINFETKEHKLIEFSADVLSRSIASLHKASLCIPASDKIRLYDGVGLGVILTRPEVALEFDLELLSSSSEEISEDHCSIFLISPNFRSPKWKFEYNGKAISATINDLKFYEALKANKITPKNGDVFDVRLRILEIKKSKGRKTYRYTINKVFGRRNVILGEEEKYP